MVEHYKGNEDVAFVAVQTVFEGFETNTAAKLEPTAQKYDLDIPFGHDPGTDGKRSNILKRYSTGGTPWVVIVDHEGKVQFNDYFLDADKTTAMVDRLAAQAQTARLLVGSKFPALDDAIWLRDKKEGNGFGDHAVTLVRFWDGGEEDSADLADLVRLDNRYGRKGMNMIAIRRATSPEEELGQKAVLKEASAAKFRGPLTIDAGNAWRAALQTKPDYPEGVESPTLLVDTTGKILWVATTDRLRREGDESAVTAYAALRAEIETRLDAAK